MVSSTPPGDAPRSIDVLDDAADVDESTGSPLPDAESADVEPADGDLRPGAPDATDWRNAIASTAIAVAVFLIVQGYEIWRRAPIGHDESVYLLRARYYAGNATEGGGTGYWASYRAPGVPAILSVPMRIVGESVSVSRGVIALFGAGTVVLTAYIAGRIGGVRAAIVAPWVILITAAFTSYSHLLLLDVPGAFCGVLAGAIMVRAIDGNTVRWWPLLAIAPVVMGGTYVRYGTITNVGAILVAIVIAHADRLLQAGHRIRNIVRLGTVAALSGVGAYLVLMRPSFTGARAAPYKAQKAFRDAKGLSLWDSYGDFGDLVWPNGSRGDEAFSWFTLTIVVVGIVLALVAAVRGARVRLVLVGLISLVLWIVGLNFGLGEVFGNYLGLGVPFLALLVAGGYAWLADAASSRSAVRPMVLIVGGLIAVIGTAASLSAASKRVDNLASLEVYRAAGAELNSQAPDQRCAIFSSYLQVAWYSDCSLRVWRQAVPGEYFVERSNDLGAFPEGAIDSDQVYLVLVDRGKRQPVDDLLTTFQEQSETVIMVDSQRPIDIRRVFDASP